MASKLSKKDLRGIAKASITSVMAVQWSYWESLYIDVLAADKEVHGREHEIIWDKIAELAKADAYPLWMDAILIVLTSVVPVNAFVRVIGSKLARSRRLLAVPLVGGFTKGRKLKPSDTKIDWNAFVKQLKNSKPIPMNMKDSKISQKWTALGRMYAPELEDGIRAMIPVAIKSGTQSIFNKDVMIQKPTKVDTKGLGLPSVVVFKGLLQWIKTSQMTDNQMLLLLKESLEDIDDENILTKIPEFIYEEELGFSTPYAGSSEHFQRFVEACLWCTTFNFYPTYHPAHEKTMSTRAEGPEKVQVNAKFDLFPFPEAVWDNLVSRHYDYFWGNGDKTFKEIPNTTYIAPAGKYNPPPTGYASGLKFDPKTRLSMHWGGILAPALFNANIEVAHLLQTYLPQK